MVLEIGRTARFSILAALWISGAALVGEAASVAVRTQPEAGHHYVIGCDWGRSNDYTVFVVLDVTAKSIVALDRSNRVDYSLQCERLKALSERWQPHQIIAEQNSIGQPVIEQLIRDELRIHYHQHEQGKGHRGPRLSL